MNNSDETLIQDNEILKAIADLGKSMNDRFEHLETKLDNFIEETNIQFEAIRAGTLANNVSFERLTSKVYAMSANLTEMQEEMRRKFAADLLAIQK